MSFLGASFLWALPLVAVPFIIHLLNRRRRQVVRWGAMRFLLESAARRRRRWRIEDLLLMLLRTSLVLLAVLFFAQPELRWAGWLSSGPRDVVLVLDTSLSTSVTDAGGSVFDKQRKAAEDLVSRLDAQDRVRVLLASTPAEWCVDEAVPMGGDGRRRVLGRLSELQPSLCRADLRKAIQQAVDADAAPGAGSRLVAVFADDQMQSWDCRAAGAWNAVRGMANSAERAAAIHVRLFRHEGAVRNRSVDSVSAARTTVHVGEPVAITAVIRNTGGSAMPACMAKLRVAGAEASSTSVTSLEAGQATQAVFSHAFDAPGVYRCSVRIEGADDLPLDNEGQLVIEVVDRLPMLVAQGAPSGSPLDGDAGYLLTALGQGGKGGARSGAVVFQPTVVPAFEVDAETIGKYPCIVLLNVTTLAADAAKALQDHVRRGAGVWIIVGDKTDAQAFNQGVFAVGRGLSPAALGKVVGDSKQREQSDRLRPPPSNHAATRLLADVDRLDIDKVQIFARFSFDGLSEQQRSAVLLATDKGEPVAIEKQVGRGRVILQALPADMSWSNLPICQAFVVMVHEWLWYLVEPMQTRWNIAPGEPFAASFPVDAYGPIGNVVLPSGTRTQAASLPRDGRRVYRCGKTMEPGPYQLVLVDAQDNQHAVSFQVNRDPAESDLAGMAQADLQTLAANSGMRTDADPLSVTAPARQAAPRPMWGWLMLAAAAALLLESTLAGWMAYRRAPASAQDAMPQVVALSDDRGAAA
jgi:hypothetical protein